jgi:FkbH-like protein
MASDLVISATFTAEPVRESLEFWMERLQLPFAVKFAAFNEVFQTLLDSNSPFAANTTGINVVALRWQDLGQPQRLEANGKSLIQTVARSAARFAVPLIVMSCPCSRFFVEEPGMSELVERLDAELSARFASNASVHFLPPAGIRDAYPVTEIHDSVSERLAHIPYTADFFAALGTALARKSLSLRRTPYKVIVLDLDNTMWTGVVGEEGWEGVRIEAERLAMQEFLLEQRAQGALLAICSKNNEKDAWEVFERRSKMLLKKEHFAAWQINWEPKSVNIRTIAKQLSLGSDSFIFIDDDVKECAEMRANAPEVLTLRIPKRAEAVSGFIRHVWAFDRGRVTPEDRKRGDSYQQERARNEEAEKAGSLEGFIAALDLRVAIEPFEPEMLSRVVQLTQRTNQFNTTTIRRTEAEVKEAFESGKLYCVTVAVSDRFGDYGNVGAVLYGIQASSLVVDSFMLSCRALGRGVEHQILRHLGNEARSLNLSEVAIRFIATSRNAPALQFLDSLESCGESGGLYTRLFRVKAEYASQLVYRPATPDITPSAQEQKPTRAQTDSKWVGAIDYGEIADHLNTVATIRAEIRANKPAVDLVVSSSNSEDGSEPRNEVEGKLAEIWAEVLGRASVGIHDDFFEMGGTSFRAVELLVRIVETFDRPDLTLSALLESPTIARFAAGLGTRRQVRCLVPLRETGSRPPFFCVPGVGGNVLSFRGLAANLPADQPFWALQAPGLDGAEPVDDAKRIAALYIAEIRTVQPHGPYYLGGGCLGGVIAYEMAQQLVAQGEEVAFLALMDAYNPAYAKMISRLRYLFCHARFFVQRLFRKTQQAWNKVAQSNERNATPGAGDVAGPLARKGADTKDPLDILARVHDANLRAGERYVPALYHGKITIFSAAERKVEPYQDHFLGWAPVAMGGIEIAVIPGRHAAFDRGMHGEVLERYLRQAQSVQQRREVPTSVPAVAGFTASLTLSKAEAA